MTPQATFMVLAPVSPGRLPELRERLASMTGLPGHARPDNPVVPFARLPTVHVARLFILDDDTLEDVRIYGLEPRNYPPYLVFLGDVDGEADAFVDEVARVAPEGLRSLFSCCEGWRDGGDLAGWMRAHAVRSSATYVNRPGRTVQRVREEAALRDALDMHVACHPELEGRPARDVHAELRRLALEDVAAGRLALSPERPTPLGWRLRNLLHLLGVPLALLLLSPLLLLALLLAAVRLRRLEKTDAELCSRTDPAHATALARIEDVDLTNQFTALGSLKPGLVRRWITRFVPARHRLVRAPRLHAGAPRPRADDPLRALGVPRRRAARRLPEQLRRQPGELHGRLHQQGRLRPEPRLQQRDRLPPRPLALPRRLLGRAQVQGVPAPPPAADRRLVQGLPGRDRGRHGAQLAASARGSRRRHPATRRRASGSRSCDGPRARVRRRPGPRPVRIPEDDGGEVRAPARPECGGRAGVAARRARDERGHAVAAARDRAARRAHGRWPRGARRPVGGSRRVLAGVPVGAQRREPCAAPRRRGRQLALGVGVGRSRPRAARARDVLRGAGQARRPRGEPDRGTVGGSVRHSALAAHRLPRRCRAVRLLRRHQPAGGRLGG